MIGIYKITSPTNKVYIGQSNNIGKRFKQYSSLSQTKLQKRLHYSFNKYGVKNHIFEVIEECKVELLNERERYWQDFYNVLGKNGLNCLLTSTTDNIKVYSKETIDKIRLGNLGKIIPDSVRKQTSETMKVKGIKPKEKMIGFDNPKSIKIIATNNITNEIYISNLSGVAKFFNVDRELISNRLNKTTVKFRKLKDWSFDKIYP
jgi:group I intron endonuclease